MTRGLRETEDQEHLTIKKGRTKEKLKTCIWCKKKSESDYFLTLNQHKIMTLVTFKTNFES